MRSAHTGLLSPATMRLHPDHEEAMFLVVGATPREGELMVAGATLAA